MTNLERLNSDLSRLARETDAFVSTAESLAPDDLTSASLCDGWDRAHVIGHVTSNARALVNLVDWAVTGQARAVYPSPEAREQDIEHYARLPREELLRAFEENSLYFAEQCERLKGELAVRELDLHGKPVSAPALPALRIAEIVLHHHDLDTAWTVAQADPESLRDALDAAVRTMRAKNAPGMTLRTGQRDEWVIGDGGQQISADRAGLLLWLARGDERGVETRGKLPALPAW